MLQNLLSGRRHQQRDFSLKQLRRQLLPLDCLEPNLLLPLGRLLPQLSVPILRQLHQPPLVLDLVSTQHKFYLNHIELPRNVSGF